MKNLFPNGSETKINKKVMVCFDLEGQTGMPSRFHYDLVETTHRLINVLNKYDVKAVFFAVGKLIEDYPDLIKEIHVNGHEIAIHGYSHEHLDNLTKVELAVFGKQLQRTGFYLEKLTGRRPFGFRSPYLAAPKFHTPELYEMLENHGYQWVSNRELRYLEELFRPDRLNLPFMWGKNNLFTHFLFILLNLKLVLFETIKGAGFTRIINNLIWLNNGAYPFFRGKLLEIPLYSPLDCDLLGLPEPDTATADKWIQYSVACIAGGINRRGSMYMLNFHDWIIGTNNRIKILDEVLRQLSQNPQVTFSLLPLNPMMNK